MFSTQGITSGLTNRRNVVLIAVAAVTGFILIKKVMQ